MTEAELSVNFAGQDAVIPFQVAPLDVRGRAVQLGPALNRVLDRHNYPEPVTRLLAEAITLTVLLGTALNSGGRFTLQTQTDGPVPMLITDFHAPGSVRAYARFDEMAVEEAVEQGGAEPAFLPGKGILAMTIDQGEFTSRYQGVVELDSTGLEEAARRYFRQSEQIPTEIRLAVGEVLTRKEGQKPDRNWIAGGVLLQYLPDTEMRMRQKDLPGGGGVEDGDAAGEEEGWAEARSLMQTIDDIELTDAAVEPERLLYRLFHEHGVHVFDSFAVRDECSCSDEKVESLLRSLTDEERFDSVEKDANGKPVIRVKCEFCSTERVYDPKTLITTK